MVSVSRSARCSASSEPIRAPTGSAIAVATGEHGFILTGNDAGAAGLLETSAAGVYAAGDVRAGSTKRAATAVGEGAAVVGYVHQHLAEVLTA
jgi:thioredoxin reductase (NADPH)